MRELAILTFVTLDGVMQAPGDPNEDRSGDFEYGGWAQECWSEVMELVMLNAMADPYDLLLGRTTYELFATHFGNAEDNNPVAERLNAASKYVVTSKPLAVPWQNSRAVTGDAATEVAILKGTEGPLLQVHGSWKLLQTLHAADLIDEYRLWVFPVVVGSGKRLFEGGGKPENLKLLKTESTSSGAVMAIYRRERRK